MSEEEKKERVLILTTALDFKLLERYSSLNRMIRVTAYCLRFCKNIQCNKDKRRVGNLESAELSEALTRLLRLAQLRDFSSEIKEIKKCREISYKGKL